MMGWDLISLAEFSPGKNRKNKLDHYPNFVYDLFLLEYCCSLGSNWVEKPGKRRLWQNNVLFDE